MRTSLGRAGDYGLRAVLYLTQHPDGHHASRLVAEAMDIPNTWLPQLLALLVEAGIVDSTTGRHGGYRLDRPPDDITMLDVIEAVEPARPTECVLRGGGCSADNPCVFHDPWFRARQDLRARLDATTFAELAASDRSLGPPGFGVDAAG